MRTDAALSIRDTVRNARVIREWPEKRVQTLSLTYSGRMFGSTELQIQQDWRCEGKSSVVLVERSVSNTKADYEAEFYMSLCKVCVA